MVLIYQVLEVCVRGFLRVWTPGWPKKNVVFGDFISFTFCAGVSVGRAQRTRYPPVVPTAADTLCIAP